MGIKKHLISLLAIYACCFVVGCAHSYENSSTDTSISMESIVESGSDEVSVGEETEDSLDGTEDETYSDSIDSSVDTEEDSDENSSGIDSDAPIVTPPVEV